MTNRILVVDGDTSEGVSVKNVLEQAGYAVGLVSSGRQALEELDSKEICLVVLDLDIPGQHAWDVLDRVTRRSPTIPVAIITRQLAHSWTREVTSLGPLLQKPLDAVELLSTIKVAIEEPREVRLRRFCAFLENHQSPS